MVQDLLSIGKLDPKLLKKLIFQRLGTFNSRVILGPRIGEDASAIEFKDKVLVVHSDPITGAMENIGWLAINIVANDIATRGVKPLWMLTVLLLPTAMDSAKLNHITQQMDKAAKELGIAIIGGHSEVTPGIKRPIIVATAMGEAERRKLVQSSGAKVGDHVIVTKGAAIEGTAILSSELAKSLQRKINSRIVEDAQKFIEKISVVKDALTAVKVRGVHAMHDATEGGVAAGLQEIAWASDVGMVAYEEKIPIYPETEIICKTLGIDPLKTISSGTLIISAQPEKAEKIVMALRKEGIRATIIGRVVDKKEGAYLVRKNGTRLDLQKPVKEELWKALEKRL